MPSEIRNNTLYRFRSIDGLLKKFFELEKQTIYFANPKKLNDPVEGFRDIRFSGDLVLWSNLLRHYMICFSQVAFIYSVVGENEKIERYIQTLVTDDNVPLELKDVWADILDSFFKEDCVDSLLKNIVKNRNCLRQSELSYYLSLFHPFVAKCVFEQIYKKGLVKYNPYASFEIKNMKSLIDAFFEDSDDSLWRREEREIDDFFIYHQLHSQQSALLMDYSTGGIGSNKRLLIGGFPFVYSKKLDKLMYPNWYTACFMSDATNSSVWGNYGDDHTGACLIFNTELDSDGNHCLPVTGDFFDMDTDNPNSQKALLRFYEVRYEHKQDSLNFFEAIGQLPIPTFNKQWLRDRNGVQSELRVTFNNVWRNKHWDGFYGPITQKTKDWEYENEYRLILNDDSGEYNDSGITLKYDFSSLSGIIFGIKTTDEDKLNIMKIINEKINQGGNSNFKFYQAYYCHHSGKIKHHELSMLKFKCSGNIR